jgi:hypothetical protein
MAFLLESAIPVLTRTPKVLDLMLRDLPPPWITGTEGPSTWSPYDVIGHLIHGERTDWMSRVEHLLTHGESKPFQRFDRYAQFENSRGKSLGQLLDTFAQLRAESLRRLTALELGEVDLDRPGLHPELGRVTLGQLLATWVAHDLDHIVQVARVMGRQYTRDVGPWSQYLRIIESPSSA